MKKNLFLIAICIVTMPIMATESIKTTVFYDETNIQAEITVSVQETPKNILKYNNTKFPSGCATGILCSENEVNINEALMVKPQITFIAEAETTSEQEINSQRNLAFNDNKDK